MWYEINVARLVRGRYYHFFATDKRSITTRTELNQVYSKIKEAFPEPEYEVSVTRYEETGTPFSNEQLKELLK